MKNKLKKYGLMTIAAVLLVALAFAGAASAGSVVIESQEDYISNFSKTTLNDDKTYYINGSWNIPSLNNGIDQLTIGGNKVVIDFTNFTGGFTNVPTSGSNIGALFGNVSILSDKTLEIKGLTMKSVTVNPDGQYIGGIIGNAIGSGNLNFTDCNLVNCSITTAGRGTIRLGGLVGNAESPIVNINDCKVGQCKFRGIGNRVGGLVGYAKNPVNIMRCNVTNSTFETGNGYNVGGLVGVADSANFIDGCNVENCSIAGGNSVSGLVAYMKLQSKIEHCIVKNCVITAAGSTGTGGIGGNADCPYSIGNCHVLNCTIEGTNNVGGLVGGAKSVSATGTNSVEYCAITGTGSNVRFDCGGTWRDLSCTVTDCFIHNSTTIPQPMISISKTSDTPSSDMKTAITVTKLSGIGIQDNNRQYACGYVIDSSPLEFNPLNGTEVYSSVIKVGAKDTFPVPTKTGYTFSGWNISSADGMNLTDAAGVLLKSVPGYTNVTGNWNNNTGTTVALYANWTAVEYNKSIIGGVATFGNGLPVVEVVVGSANPNITNVSFEFMGAPADIATKPSGYKSISTINDAFNLSITGTQDADVTVVFNATDSGTIFLAHNKSGNWEFLKATATGNPNEYKSNVTKESGFSPFQIISAVANDPVYTPSSSKQTGSTIILQEGQTAPTASATAAPTVTPTAKPTEQPATPTVIATAKPTTQATQQSPAPFVGLLAGLGAAGLVLARLRK